METRIKKQLEKNQFVIDFTVPDIHNFNHTLDELVRIFKKTRTLKVLAKEYAVIVGPMWGNDGGKRLYEFWSERESIKQHIREVYEILDLPPIKE
jgi:hypothetical protein